MNHSPLDRAVTVAHVISGDLWAGAEVMAYNLIREQARNPAVEAVAVVLNAGTLASRIDDLGIPILVLDESKQSIVKLYRAIHRWLREKQPTVIHTHRQKENILGALAARSLAVASVRTVHGWHEFSPPWHRLDKHFIRWLDRYAGRRWQQMIIAVSPELREKLLSQYFDAKLATVENGIDLAAIRVAGQVENFPQDISFDQQRQHIGIVARVVPVKRHDRLLAAASILAATSPKRFRFHIIGDGPGLDELKVSIATMSEKLDIQLHGFQSAVAALISQLQAIVICSDHEGIPMNALEAAALGVPIATTPLPSIASIIESGAKGIIAKDLSAEALATAIDEASKLGDANIPLADDWLFSAKTMASRYLECYLEVADRGPKCP